MSLPTLANCLSSLLESGLFQSANHPGSGAPSSSSVMRVCSSTFGAALLVEGMESGRGKEGEEGGEIKERWYV